MLAFAITALVVLVAAAIALAWAWTVKAPVRMAFIRTSGGGRGGDGDEGPVGRVISSFLTAGAARPLPKELLDFAKADPEAMLKKVPEHVPALREAMGPKA